MGQNENTEIKDKVVILNLIASRPLFSRFLKELGLRGYYAHNSISPSAYGITHIRKLPDEGLIIGAFEWGGKDTCLPCAKWIYAHKQWLDFIHNPNNRKQIIAEQHDNRRR